MSDHAFYHSLSSSAHSLTTLAVIFSFLKNDNQNVVVSTLYSLAAITTVHRRGISLLTAMSTHDPHKLDWHFDTELEDETIELRGRKLFFVIVLFAIVLFTTALFLYTRWICRSRALLPTTTTTTTTTAFTSSIHAPPQSEGLDAAVIKKLPIVLHQVAESPDPNSGGALLECCICLSAFRDGEKLKVLPVCEHCFHCECVDKWLTNHSSCPLCRASLKLDPSSFPKILIQEPPLRINDRF